MGRPVRSERAPINARPKAGMFFQAGINAQKRIFDQCNFVDAGIPAYVINAANAGTPEVSPPILGVAA